MHRVSPCRRSKPISTAKGGRRGIALPMVFLAITVFFIIGGVLVINTYNEQPAVRRLDRNLEARYLARSLAEVVRLKLKSHPEEFMEALREKELADKSGSGATPLFDTWASDFNDADRVREDYGIGGADIASRLVDLRRIYIGQPEMEAGVQYVTDVVELKIAIEYQLGRREFAPEDTVVKLELDERVRFRRRFKKE